MTSKVLLCPLGNYDLFASKRFQLRAQQQQSILNIPHYRLQSHALHYNDVVSFQSTTQVVKGVASVAKVNLPSAVDRTISILASCADRRLNNLETVVEGAQLNPFKIRTAGNHPTKEQIKLMLKVATPQKVLQYISTNHDDCVRIKNFVALYFATLTHLAGKKLTKLPRTMKGDHYESNKELFRIVRLLGPGKFGKQGANIAEMDKYIREQANMLARYKTVDEAETLRRVWAKDPQLKDIQIKPEYYTLLPDNNFKLTIIPQAELESMLKELGYKIRKPK